MWDPLSEREKLMAHFFGFVATVGSDMLEGEIGDWSNTLRSGQDSPRPGG